MDELTTFTKCSVRYFVAPWKNAKAVPIGSKLKKKGRYYITISYFQKPAKHCAGLTEHLTNNYCSTFELMLLSV